MYNFRFLGLTASYFEALPKFLRTLQSTSSGRLRLREEIGSMYLTVREGGGVAVQFEGAIWLRRGVVETSEATL
jgi:hypothetical protein